MRKKRVAEIERKGGMGKPIEIFVERTVDLDPSCNTSELTKVTKIVIAPDGEITHEALIDKTKEK